MGAEIENSDVYQRFAVRQAFLPDDYVYVFFIILVFISVVCNYFAIGSNSKRTM